MTRAPALLAGALAIVMPVALAQPVQRPFPANALRGDLIVRQPPQVELNGVPARLAPGARIQGENNLLVMSGAVSGQTLIVHYTREESGLVKDVWVLTPAERARQPWPRTPREAAQWQFDTLAQTWRKP